MMEEVSILILAGGKSQRMGQNKAFLKLNGVSFLEHIISVLRPLQSEIYISGSKKQYNSIELPIIEDHPDFKGQGPLSGILSGLMTIKSDWLFVISVDAPQISIEQVLELYKHTKAKKMASSIPGILRSKSGNTASGVISRTDNPVPPVKITKSAFCSTPFFTLF